MFVCHPRCEDGWLPEVCRRICESNGEIMDKRLPAPTWDRILLSSLNIVVAHVSACSIATVDGLAASVPVLLIIVTDLLHLIIDALLIRRGGI